VLKDVKKDEVGWTDYGEKYWENFHEDLQNLSAESQQQVGLSVVMSLVQGRCRENPIDIDSVATPLEPRKKKKKKNKKNQVGNDTGSTSSSSSSSSVESTSSSSILMQNGIDTNVNDTSGWIAPENIGACDNDVPKEFMERNVIFRCSENDYRKGTIIAWSPTPVSGWANPHGGTWRVKFTCDVPDCRASTDVIREALNLFLCVEGVPDNVRWVDERKILKEIDQLKLTPPKIKRRNNFEFSIKHMLHLFLEVTQRGIAGHGLQNRTFESMKDNNEEWQKILKLCVPPEVIAGPNTKLSTRNRIAAGLIKKLKKQYESHLLGIEQDMEAEDQERNDFTIEGNQTSNDEVESTQISTSTFFQEPSDTANTIRDDCSSLIQNALGVLQEFVDSGSSMDVGPVLALQSILKTEQERLITPGHGRYRRVMMLADTNSGKSTLMNLLGRISEQKQHSGTDHETELKRVIHETLLDLQPPAEGPDIDLQDEVDDIFQQQHQNIFVVNPNQNNEAYVSHEMLDDDKKATEELMVYHSNDKRASDTKTASQFLFETGAQGSTTTEVGYGIRFGNHYATVVKYRTENEMVQEILDYPYDPNDNDDDNSKLRERMVKLLHTLTGNIETNEENDDDDEDLDSDDEAELAFAEGNEVEEWPKCEEDIQVCAKIREVAGNTYIYPSKGEDQTNDRLYTRKVVKKIAFGHEGTDVRMALSFLTVYAPWAVLEQNIEFREAPGCRDSNPIKARNLEIELEEADQVICMMERDLESFGEGKKYLVSHVFPRYLATKTLDEWKLESFFRKAKASEETKTFFESLINRVALNEVTVSQGKTEALSPGPLLNFITTPKNLATLKMNQQELQDLVTQCIENVPAHRSQCDKRVELAFVSMGEKTHSYTLESILDHETNGVQNLKATGPKPCKPSYMRTRTKKQMITQVALLIEQVPLVDQLSKVEKHALKILLFTGFSNSYACAWPMLYASLLCARADGKIDENQFSLEDQVEAQRLSGGADIVRIFMSLPLRQARQCMNRVTTALSDDKKFLKPLRSWGGGNIPNFVQNEVQKNLKVKMKRQFTDDLAEIFRENENPFFKALGLTDADGDEDAHLDLKDDAFDLTELKNDFAELVDELQGNEAKKLKKVRAVFFGRHEGRFKGIKFSVRHRTRKAIISNQAFQSKLMYNIILCASFFLQFLSFIDLQHFPKNLKNQHTIASKM